MSSEHEEIEQVPEEPAAEQETAEVQEEAEAKEAPKPKKPHYGGRKAHPNKEDLTDKTECDDCNKTISKHAKKYTHRCPAKKKDVVIEAIEERVPAPDSGSCLRDTEPPKEKAAPKRTREAAPLTPKEPTQQPQRRLLDLDQPIDHNDVNVHHVVSSYVRSLKEHQNIAKREKYKSMLAGRI